VTDRPSRRRGATRDDVARRAGVSNAVVSYVVNAGPRPVAPATRERVLAVIEELGYRPNSVARSLRARRSFALGLVVPDSANPFFSELGKAVEDAGFDAGYTLLLGNSMDDEERERHYVRTFIERQVDGLVLISVSRSGLVASELGDSRIPVVSLQSLDARIQAPTILVDNEGGAAEAVRHLLEHGADSVACLTGPAGIPSADERAHGWAAALDAAGAPVAGRVCVRTEFSRSSGYRAALRLLVKQRPRALFVASDEQAYGVLRAAAELGVRVPGELALVAFDGIPANEFTVPSLSTMRIPFRELGRAAVRCLVDQIDGGRSPEGGVDRLPATLERRASCGCPDRPARDVVAGPNDNPTSASAEAQPKRKGG
jgi:LacI family transcriptional regulator